MNEEFSFNRFFSLFKKQFYEKRIFFLGISVIVICLEILVYAQNSDFYQTSLQPQLLCLVVLLVLSPTVLINFLVNDFANKKTSVSNLLLPVSYLEKWMVVFTFYFLLFLPFHIAVLKIIDYGFVSHTIELWIKTKSKYFTLSQIKSRWFFFSFNSINSAGFGLYFIFSFYVSGVFLLGSMFFKNLSYFKTALVFIGLVTAFLYGTTFITKTLIGEDLMLNFTDFSAMVNLNSRTFWVHSTKPISYIMMGYSKIIFPLSLWLIALLRFKEKEI